MHKEIGYEDWDTVVKACEKEFKLITATRKAMDVAEACQKVTHELALKERDKFPEPKKEPETKAEEKPKL